MDRPRPPRRPTALPAPSSRAGTGTRNALATGSIRRVALAASARYTRAVQTDSVELTIQVPASLADAGAGERARVLLVLDAVRSERMTWRVAASALDVAPDRLLELARAHGVPTVRYESGDLHEDLSTLAKLERGRTSGA